MMTLRQIEVIRAVMVTGTIGGAAKLLNVSAPGISRLVKYTEKSLGIRFFQRQNGRYFPTPEAQNIFEQINGVYKKVDDLTEIISKIGHGALSELRVGSVPSISQVMVPRAIERVRRRYADLRMDINILKIEEAVDYLLLGRGDCVAMSYRLDHSGLDFLPLASGELFCIVPEGHELAGRKQISAAEIIRYPLIGARNSTTTSPSAPGSAPPSAPWSRLGLASPSSINSPSPMAASPESNRSESLNRPNSIRTSR
jgi:DNA-binding transcriptional LysR family regulator